MKSFPFYKQYDQMDCGPTCLRMIAQHYGKHFTLQYLREISYINREGVSLLGISDAAEQIGFRTKAYKLPFSLLSEVPVPVIAHWDQNHFVVIYKITSKKVLIADPGIGLVSYSHEEFIRHWASTTKDGEKIGVVMELEPTPRFYDQEEQKQTRGFQFLFQYVWSYKKLLVQLIIGILIGSIILLIFPFLTQAIVDYGISDQDVRFIYLILIAQVVLFFGKTSIEFIRSWILLHIGTRINISLISDFLMKLLKLPLGFFDTKMIGDILQRIQDHRRIEQFLTATTLNSLFSLISLLIFGIVLFLYSLPIFLVFFGGSILYFLWILIFLRKRKTIDHKRFAEQSQSRSHIIQLVQGIQDIKLNNSEKQKRWGWEQIQARLFKVNIQSLALEQYQTAGATFINQFKDIIITFLAAKSVIDGDMTLGMLVAVQYIVGQMNVPINQLIGLTWLTQDASISLDRLSEIHEKKEEENPEEQAIKILPENGSLSLDNVSFQYGGPHSEKVLKNISLHIPEGKTTAIVGTSGSGKTTLIKLLLKFYDPTEGSIRLGDIHLKNIRHAFWRSMCGVVMQDGYVFSDTIANNIALGKESIDQERLLYAVKLSNIQSFIESLPLGYNTKIGDEGIGLSAGQKQRLLIARAIYKNPDYLYFDEATNALDANNEKVIYHNLQSFFKGKTVVVVAHRLSTVKHADQIIVLERGSLIEKGSHEELTKKQGAYYRLVKNQLELGN